MDIQWFPTKAEAEFGIAEDDSIVWTARGLDGYAKDLHAYGFNPGRLTDWASLQEAFKVVFDCGSQDVIGRLNQKRKNLSPHSNAYLENQWLAAIITGRDDEVDRLRKKHAVRRTLSLISRPN
jgi:hypothetical protein